MKSVYKDVKMALTGNISPIVFRNWKFFTLFFIFFIKKINCDFVFGMATYIFYIDKKRFMNLFKWI